MKKYADMVQIWNSPKNPMFISYKREDKKEAKRLQRALKYYRLPNHPWQENPELS